MFLCQTYIHTICIKCYIRSAYCFDAPNGGEESLICIIRHTLECRCHQNHQLTWELSCNSMHPTRRVYVCT